MPSPYAAARIVGERAASSPAVSAAAGVLAMTAAANNDKPGLVGAKVDNFMLIDQQGIGHLMAEQPPEMDVPTRSEE